MRAHIRVDASVNIGMGHLMRCLSLAARMSSLNARCKFFCINETREFVPKFAKDRYEWIFESNVTLENIILNEEINHDDILVIDSYEICVENEEKYRKKFNKIIIIDDLLRKHNCDYLIDQTYGRKDKEYSDKVPGSCKILTGTKYALIRDEFRKYRRKAIERRFCKQNRKDIFISVGSIDQKNILAEVLNALRDCKSEINVNIIISQSSPGNNDLETIKKNLHYEINIYESPDNIAEIMTNSDIAIGAAGSTSWERCCLGLPSIILVTSDNQEDVATGLMELGASIKLDGIDELHNDLAAKVDELLTDKTMYDNMSDLSTEVCDGYGVLRVLLNIIEHEHAKDGSSVCLRLADAADSKIMYQWQLAEKTRKFSRNSNIPTSQEHAKWVSKHLNEYQYNTFIICHADEPSGVIRVDKVEHSDMHEVSILIAPEKYNLGIAKASLKMVRKVFPMEILQAEVLPGNKASNILFASAGYMQIKAGIYIDKP